MTREQFIHYVENNQRALRRFLIALCYGDSDLADDLAQDTFVKAYLSCDSFREDSKLSTWLYRIAYNTYISNRRMVRRNESIVEAEQLSSHERSDRAFDYQALYLALEKLSEKERSAILLHYMHGFAIDEVADITGSSVDAVKQLLSRGRRHLKGLLTD